jgi:hypothetical protein
MQVTARSGHGGVSLVCDKEQCTAHRRQREKEKLKLNK